MKICGLKIIICYNTLLFNELLYAILLLEQEKPHDGIVIQHVADLLGCKSIL